MKDFQDKLNNFLQNSIIPANALVGNCKKIQNYKMDDPKYLPFYYHLGKLINPKYIVNLDFFLGLKEVCFLKSCKSVEKIIGIIPKHFKLDDLGVKYGKDNIKNLRNLEIEIVYELSNNNGCDLVFCDNIASVKSHISNIWQNLSLDGLLIIEDIRKDDFVSFASSLNRDPMIFDKVGIVRR